jgi:hypothetical protein
MPNTANSDTPLWMRKGGGTLRPWRALRLGVQPGLFDRKTEEQSENVYENKGSAGES